MSQQEIVNLLITSGTVGAVLTPVISFLKGVFKLEEGEHTDTKRRIKLALSVVTSIGGALLATQLAGALLVDSLSNLVVTATVVFSASAIVYNAFWKDTKAEERVESLGYVGVGK